MTGQTVARTFIQLPDTRLPTLVKADLSQRRIEDTIVIAGRPEAGSVSPPPMARPVEGRRKEGSLRAAADATTLVSVAGGQAESPQAAARRASEQRIPLPPGFVIARYRIHAPIGEGGFALTYRATDMNLDRQIVIKELFLPEHCEREESLAIRSRSGRDAEKAFQWAGYYFSQEAKITADLRHESIVRLNDFFKTNGTAYIVYEMLDGSDLAKYGTDRRHVFSHVEGLDLVRYCAEALLYVHERGFLHRDIKPSNIFIDTKSRRPILIDFGAAKDMAARRSDDFLAVSDGFSPPELYATGTDHDPRTDIYSLCATAYWVLSGQRPATSTARLVQDDLLPLSKVVGTDFKFGERLSRVIETGMRPRAEDRYPDIPSLMDDLFPRVHIPASGYIGEPRGDKIFLSYRREDSAHFSGRLLDYLEMRFGTGSTFFDVELIPAGIDFWDHIKATLQRCSVLVVVIGPDWLQALSGRQRKWYHLGRRVDFVEGEIRAAMEMRLPILPVLFDGAAMPSEKQLPKGLRQVAGLNAAIVGSGKLFRQGADAVCDQIASIRTSLERRTH